MCGITLTLLFPVPCWVGDNTDLSSNSNISKAVTVNTFIRAFFKECFINFLMVCSLIDFALVVLKLLIFKVCGITGIIKIEFSNIFATERVNENPIPYELRKGTKVFLPPVKSFRHA